MTLIQILLLIIIFGIFFTYLKLHELNVNIKDLHESIVDLKEIAHPLEKRFFK